MSVRLHAVLLLLGFACTAAVAQQMYRWTDERGVVNYGDAPPRGAKDVRPVKSGQVTVVPAVPKQQIEQMRQRDAQRQRDQATREAEEARARQAAEQAELQAYARPPIEVSEVWWPEGEVYWPTHVRPPPVSRPQPRPPVRPTPLPADRPALGQPPLPLGQPPIISR